MSHSWSTSRIAAITLLLALIPLASNVSALGALVTLAIAVVVLNGVEQLHVERAKQRQRGADQTTSSRDRTETARHSSDAKR